jgi:hypothetical protein
MLITVETLFVDFRATFSCKGAFIWQLAQSDHP